MKTITGTLGVVKGNLKRESKNPLAFLVERCLEEVGLVKMERYKSEYYIKDGTKATLGKREFDFIYKFPGTPRKLQDHMEGWKITVKGELDYWGNGLGATFKTGYRIIEGVKI